MTVQVIDADEAPSDAPYTCPRCGHAGVVAAQSGYRIVTVQTKLYVAPLGR